MTALQHGLLQVGGTAEASLHFQSKINHTEFRLQ